MANNVTSGVDTLTLTPSETTVAITAMMATRRAVFLWGPPGIAKSAIGSQIATSRGIAFIDLRLSQMDPTDLRGIPYPTTVNGVAGVRWAPPVALPRDIDISAVIDTEIDGTRVDYLNPIGSNNIHYCVDPKVTVSALTPVGATAEIVEETLDRFVVIVRDSDGNPVEGRVRYTVTGKSKAILALEEFNSAPPSVTTAAYQLIHDRKIGDDYSVPEGVFIMAMGNRDTDKGVTFKMATPVSNRFVHIEMRADFDDWQQWALGTGIHPEVIGYLSAFKSHLFDFQPGTAARGFATPRSWHSLSDAITANPDLGVVVETAIVNGAIGEGIGLQFLEFRRLAENLPKPDEVLSGRLKKLDVRSDASLAFALTAALCYELKHRADGIRRAGKDGDKNPERIQWLAEADNFLGFIMENFAAEVCVMGAKSAIAIHYLPFDTVRMKNFDPLVDKYHDIITA